MEQYFVTGMSCAACVSRVEKAVNAVDGVESCSVSLLTNSMGVEGNVSPTEVIKAVTDAGYGASLKNKSDKNNSNNNDFEQEEALKDHETPALKKRLYMSIGFLAVLMYFSMGHMMFGWPLPKFFEGNHVAMGILQMLLAIVIMIINNKFFVSGFKSLIHRSPNMDTLVALGSTAAFVYSTYALFAMTGCQVNQDMDGVMYYMDQFYFEAAATILTLITVGKMLEARSKGKTTDALKGLMKLAPKTAVILVDGKEQEVEINRVNIGDIFLVYPGENIPVDGIVVEGSSAVNEAALTGESIPVDKEIGDQVSAATLNQSGFIKCRATRVGEDTTLSQIIQMVSDAAATKAPIAKIADRVSGVFVPAVIIISLITTFVWLILGKEFGYALARGISVLVISCPCALGLATPVAIMVGNGIGAKNGIMFKTAVSLEETGKTQIVVLDKTGTITSGTPKVTDIVTVDDFSEDELVRAAYSLEKKSEHPLAKAILEHGNELKVEAEEVEDFSALPGNGLEGKYRGKDIFGGSLKFISKKVSINDEIKDKANILSQEGKTPLLFAYDDKLIGIIAVADVIKEDSTLAVQELKNMGIHVVMLTGDNEKTANAIGKQTGVDEVIAGVLPDGKEAVIRKLKEKGKVAMVGDGINDAPALTRADIGIAIGAGTDIAIDAADVVLMKSKLSDVSAAIRLSKKTLTNIHQNLFYAFIYNVTLIPLAAGLFVPIFGWTLNPMLGAAAMSLSSFCVVSNALRLNFFNIYDARKDKKIKNTYVNDTKDVFYEEETKEEEKMTKTLMIEGMMCPHCEKAVRTALEAIDGVESAEPSHVEKKAVVTLSEDVANDVLQQTVEAAGYKVLSVE